MQLARGRDRQAGSPGTRTARHAAELRAAAAAAGAAPRISGPRTRGLSLRRVTAVEISAPDISGYGFGEVAFPNGYWIFGTIFGGGWGKMLWSSGQGLF